MSIEKQLVSTLASNPELITTIQISSDEFTDGRIAQIFDTVTGLIRDGREPDMFLVAEAMNFENPNGNWLPDIVDCFGHPAIAKNLPSYEHVIRETKRKRQLKQVSQAFVNDLENENPGAVHSVMEGIRNLESKDLSLIKTLDSIIPIVVQHIDDVESGNKKPGLMTGLRDLDVLLGGLIPGDQVVLAARTSVGKTAMMVNLAVNIDEPCLIISGEQGAEQIAQRVIAKMGGISAYRLRMGRIRSDEHLKFAETAAKIKQDQKIFIVDKSRPSIDDIEQLARAAKWKHNIKAVFIDYLQLINHPTEKDKRLQIVDISKRGKQLARELDIPVIMLAQLNRNAEGRTPRISDLKESGSIEEDADAIILLYPHEESGNQLTMDLQKHRNGPTGCFQVAWNPEFMRAEDL